MEPRASKPSSPPASIGGGDTTRSASERKRITVVRVGRVGPPGMRRRRSSDQRSGAICARGGAKLLTSRGLTRWISRSTIERPAFMMISLPSDLTGMRRLLDLYEQHHASTARDKFPDFRTFRFLHQQT